MDKNLETIINRVANRNSVNNIKARLATEILFKNVKQLMQRDEMPTIFLHGLGRFTPDERKIRRRLNYIDNHLALKSPKEDVDKERERFSQILKYIEESKHTRNK